jgi:hypothetical protein
MAGSTAGGVIGKSPLRYIKQILLVTTTANVTGAPVGVVPPGGAKLKDVTIAQAAAGVGGTSWKATPKVAGTALLSTDPVLALSDGANKSVNVGNTGGPPAIAKPAGATRGVIKVDGTAAAAGGAVVTVDIVLTGTYSTAVACIVELLWESNY